MPFLPTPTPYGYLDYRKFLSDFFAFKKTASPSYSYRVFCRKAGMNSPGLVSEVMSGKRALSTSYAKRFALGLGLDEAEEAYFLDLVAYTQAKTDNARRLHYGRLLQSMPLRVQGLRRSQWEYFSHWHHVAVRETLAILDFHDDFATLGRAIRPRLTAAQARASVELLAKLGLIARQECGRWVACNASLETPGDESQSLLFRAYRKEMLTRAAEALDRDAAEAQIQTCTTVSISQAAEGRIRALMDEFQRRVIETIRADQNEDRVMQLNIQWFPLAYAKDAHAK